MALTVFLTLSPPPRIPPLTSQDHMGLEEIAEVHERWAEEMERQQAQLDQARLRAAAFPLYVPASPYI